VYGGKPQVDAGIEEQKKRAGIAAPAFVENGMVVGLGTGSTVYYTIMELARKIRDEGLDIVAVPTSKATELLAKKEGISLSTLKKHPLIDITIDGADEVTPDLVLLKGAGGALLWEKIVASSSRSEIIVIDERKLVQKLGRTMPLPVEVNVFAGPGLEERFIALGALPELRMRGISPFVTDSGNHIYDLKFESIEDPKALEKELNNIPGVLENGLFLDLTSKVIVGCRDGTRVLEGQIRDDALNKGE